MGERNEKLRALRKALPSRVAPGECMSRAELAEAVNDFLWETTRRRYELDGHIIARYERGAVRWPSAHYRAGLRAVLGANTDAELGFRPTPRGNTTHSATVSSAAHHIDDSPSDTASPAAVRASYPSALSPVVSCEEAAVLVAHAHRSYQRARYGELAKFLPGLEETVDSLVSADRPAWRREAWRLQCSTSIVAAKLATKTGDGRAAVVAAEKAKNAALQAADRFGQAGAAYQLACALLKSDLIEAAERVAVESAESLAGSDPESLAWRGSLLLISAIIAARRDEQANANQHLEHAQWLAKRLGGDTNIGWTAFGVTNVRIHQMSVAVGLNDPRTALAVAEQIDIGRLQGELRGRQGRFHLESAWAHCKLREDAYALIHLLDAERVAPELVYASNARKLVADLLSRERRHVVPGLRALAQRVGAIG